MHADASTRLTQISSPVKTRAFPVRTLVAHRKSLIAAAAQAIEIDHLLKDGVERIVVERIGLIGRKHPREHVEEKIAG